MPGVMVSGVAGLSWRSSARGIWYWRAMEERVSPRATVWNSGRSGAAGGGGVDGGGAEGEGEEGVAGGALSGMLMTWPILSLAGSRPGLARRISATETSHSRLML